MLTKIYKHFQSNDSKEKKFQKQKQNFWLDCTLLLGVKNGQLNMPMYYTPLNQANSHQML